MNYKAQMLAERKAVAFLLVLLIAAFKLGCDGNNVIIEAPPTIYYGFVTDSSTTLPIAGAELRVDSIYLETTTDSSGFYRFPRLGANLKLFCTATNYQSQSKTVGSRPADSLQVDFKLVP